jgi:hypothetical protein
VFDLRGYGELTGLLDETVPPAMLRRHVTREILGIVNQHIRVPTKLGKLLKARGLCIRWLEFVIRQVDDRPPRMLDAIACAPTRMIRRNPREVAAALLDDFQPLLQETEHSGRQILRCHWKVHAIHLLKGWAPQGVTHTGRQERDHAMRLIDRGKKRESLDVVPMGMRQQHKDIRILGHQALSQRADPGARIQHQEGAVPQIDTDARRIASIAHGGGPRGRNRATHPQNCRAIAVVMILPRLAEGHV